MIWIKRIGLILLIIFLGTIIDYVIHELNHNFAVPFSYFTHKVAYGTLWGLLGYLALRKWIHTPFHLAFTISATPAVLLQVWYVLKEHELPWVIIFFLFVHFFCFLLPGYYICRKYENIFLR